MWEGRGENSILRDHDDHLLAVHLNAVAVVEFAPAARFDQAIHQLLTRRHELHEF
jgi:hypothetical protein